MVGSVRADLTEGVGWHRTVCHLDGLDVEKAGTSPVTGRRRVERRNRRARGGSQGEAHAAGRATMELASGAAKNGWAVMEQSIRIGRIAGVDVGFNWSLLVVAWLIAWSLAVGRFPEQFPGHEPGTYWFVALLTSLLFFACLLAHELGHAVVARRAGVKVDGITLWLFGGVARLRGEAVTPEAELRIAAVGPAISLVLGALFALLALGLDLSGTDGLTVGAPAWLALINTVLAIFNLVPAFPLDGGRVLRAILCRRSGNRIAATHTAARAGRLFAYVLLGLGIVEFAYGAGIGGLWFVFLGWFLMGAAQAEESQTLLRASLRDIRVEDIMSPHPVTVPDRLSVQTFIDNYVMTARFSAFPLRDERGEIVGLITLARVKKVPSDERATTSVASIACPRSEVAVGAPHDPVTELLERMQGGSDGRALVFAGNELVGIVTSRDVQRAFERAGLRAGIPRSL